MSRMDGDGGQRLRLELIDQPLDLLVILRARRDDQGVAALVRNDYRQVLRDMSPSLPQVGLALPKLLDLGLCQVAG